MNLEDIYHEVCIIEVEKTILEKSNLRKFKVKKVDVPDFDYSEYPQWIEQRKISTKAYKRLKEIEYNIRQK
jgi:hypothetical protein